MELVATNDIHYILEEDAVPHDILLCIQTGKKVTDENRMRYEGGQFYCKSEEQMRELFPYAQEAIDNTHRIAERCNVEIEFGVTKLPKYDANGRRITWTVTETAVGGCTVSIRQEGVTFVVTNSRTPSTPAQPSTPAGPSLPQTGTVWWPVGLLAVCGAALVLAGLRCGKGKRDA